MISDYEKSAKMEISKSSIEKQPSSSNTGSQDGQPPIRKQKIMFLKNAVAEFLSML